MSERVALVTGGASGMGRIFALRMARGNFRVAVLDRSADALEALRAEHPDILTFAGDVADAAGFDAIVAEIAKTLGPVDRLVHCAAIFPTGTLDAQPLESIHTLMQVNYGGTVNAVRAVLPAMRERDSGEIVVFGSIGGAVPVPGCGAYCATKAAVNSFTETLAEELRDTGIHVLLVCPPLVDTPLLQQATATGNPRMVRDAIARRRFADPEKMIAATERGLARGKSILYPAEAGPIAWMRRFSPALVRRILRTAGRE